MFLAGELLKVSPSCHILWPEITYSIWSVCPVHAHVAKLNSGFESRVRLCFSHVYGPILDGLWLMIIPLFFICQGQCIGRTSARGDSRYVWSPRVMWVNVIILMFWRLERPSLQKSFRLGCLRISFLPFESARDFFWDLTRSTRSISQGLYRYCWIV